MVGRGSVFLSENLPTSPYFKHVRKTIFPNERELPIGDSFQPKKRMLAGRAVGCWQAGRWKAVCRGLARDVFWLSAGREDQALPGRAAYPAQRTSGRGGYGPFFHEFRQQWRSQDAIAYRLPAFFNRAVIGQPRIFPGPIRNTINSTLDFIVKNPADLTSCKYGIKFIQST